MTYEGHVTYRTQRGEYTRPLGWMIQGSDEPIHWVDKYFVSQASRRGLGGMDITVVRKDEDGCVLSEYTIIPVVR